MLFSFVGCTSNQKAPGASTRTQPLRPLPAPTQVADPTPPSANTDVVMHNVILIKSDGLRLRVRWLRGSLVPTRKTAHPSFDDLASFDLAIQTGAMAVNLSELSSLLGDNALPGTPLRHISLAAHGKQLLIRGTLHKGIPLPVELIGTPGAAGDGRLKIHVDSLRVLEIPVKPVLRAFNVQAADLFDTKQAKGIEVQGNDIYLQPAVLLPPPHEIGKLSDAHIEDGELIQIFGSARPEIARRRQWRNYVRLRGGVLDFGKLTMRYVDITMIDTSDDPWFEFDLSRYQEQLVNGVTHMTPQAGLQIFMPDVSRIPKTKANSTLRLEWVKNRNEAPPPDVLK
jgi:hypothetical protein